MQLAVVTGGHAGIGLELSKLLLRGGWRLILLKRPGSSSPLGRENITYIDADLSSQPQLTEACRQLLAREDAIDALFNNAGVLLGKQIYSPQKVEMHFQVNTLAPYILTRLLRPALAAAKGTVVNTSSGAAALAGKLDIENLKSPPVFRKLYGPYAQSKLALNTMTAGLATEYVNDAILLRCADPGPNRTKMTVGQGMPLMFRWMVPLAFASPKRGAKFVLSGIDPKWGTQTGVLLSKGKIAQPTADAISPEIQQKLLALCRSLTGL